MKGLLCHDKKLGHDPKSNGALLKAFRQGRDVMGRLLLVAVVGIKIRNMSQEGMVA